MKNVLLKLFLFCVLSGYANKRFDVLLISSYNSRFPSFFHQINGIKSVLDTCHVNIDLEFMDTKRFMEDQHLVLFKKCLEYKISKKKRYDLVITTDDNALHFVEENYKNLFNKIPVVFCSVNNVDYANEVKNTFSFTGVIEAISIRETLEQMFLLFPDASEFYVIGDKTPSSKANHKDLKRLHKKYFSHKECHDISLMDLSFQEYIEKLETIPENTPVLLLSAYRDRLGKTNDFNECMLKLNTHLRAPVFSLWRHGMGEGVLGGKIISHYEQGKNAALKALKILRGASVGTIPLLSESPNVFMFDYHKLREFNLSKKSLPKDAVILNLPNNFYQKNKRFIHIALVVFLVLLTMLFVLSINIVKRKSAEVKLKEHQNDLEKLIQEKTKNLELANRDLKHINSELSTTLRDLKQAQSKLVETEKMASLGVLTAGIAHEINNPLNYIKGAALALKTACDSTSKNPMIVKMLGMIETGVDRATQIVKGLNQFSRNSEELNEKCSIHGIINNSLAMLKYKLKQHIEVKKLFSDEDLIITGNVGKLHQVLVNILTNAIDAIEKEGVVEITTKKQENYVFVTIQDSGCGIEKEVLSEIIEPFYTTKPPGKGTGLGMSIVYSIIKEHKGELEINSILGQGTSITLKLPI